MGSTTVYDFVIASPYTSYEFFAHYMRQHCGQMRISFFFVNDVWVNEFLEKVRKEEIKVKVLLDMSTEQADEENPYTILAKEVKERGAYMIDDPETAERMCHKGYAHRALNEAGVPVPETIVLTRDEIEGFRLNEEIERRIGTPFVVKPAMGYWGGAGVFTDASSDEDIRRCLRECPRSDAFLIQQRLTMKDLGEHKGWFRIFYICGTVVACWWDPVSHEYDLVTPAQFKKYKLAPLKKVVRSTAQVSNMKKFSSEVCLHSDNKFYAVDYVNSTPDMNPRSFYPNGVPDEVVRYIAYLLFSEAMHQVKKGQGYFDMDLEDL